MAAPTGIAAKNAEGQTLHSMFGLKTITFIPGKTRNWFHLDTAKEKIIRKLDILIIDEISMVRCDVLDMVDQTLKKIRWSGSAFGGILVIFFGDLFQLPPVVENEDEELLYSHYEKDSPYFFSSDVIRKHPFPLLELEKVHRQKDERFVRILNNIREGKILASDIATINKRFKADYEPSNTEPAVYLRTRKYNVWRHNNNKLKELPGEIFNSTADIDGYFPKRLFPADEELALKIGAKVMLLRNDNDSYEYVNGTLGIVKDINGEIIKVITQEGKLISVKKSAWTLYKYEYDERNKIIMPYPVGSFTQYPIKLAWAVTIHKSQGLTFDNVIIDAHRAFASGQVYVALSRCRSLEGIILTSRITESDILVDEKILSYIKNVDKIIPDTASTTREEKKSNIFVFNNSATITGIKIQASGDIVIPEGVKLIAESAFKDNNNIKSVLCPASLWMIGDHAFDGCKNLQNIKFNEGLYYIGNNAFIGTGLKSVFIPSSVAILHRTSFECTVNIHNDNQHFIDIDGLIYDKITKNLVQCPNKKAKKIIEVDYSCNSIEEYAFEGSEAEEIILPENLFFLEDYIFTGCRNLRTLTFKSIDPDSIDLEKNTFTGFEVEKCVLRVPYDALSEYVNDERFNIFKYITAIEGSRCLKYNESGTEVVGCDVYNCENIVIPEGVTKICEGAFEGNEEIERVVLPKTLLKIENASFYDCHNLSEIKLNKGLRDIGSDAFRGAGMSCVKIPDSVVRIGHSAFSCDIEVGARNTNYSANDGILYSNDGKKLVIYPEYKENEEFEIPGTVEIIGSYAFEDTCIETLIIPESITSLHNNIFGCTSEISTLILHCKDPNDLYIDDSIFEDFNKQQCKLVVPNGSLPIYASNKHFKDFLSICEMSENGEYSENATEPESCTGQFYEKLPGNTLAESKVFCYYEGKYHCYIVLTPEGFFLKLMDGGYYYLSGLIDNSVSGSIWVMNKKEKLTSYMVAFSTDNVTKYSFGHFNEQIAEELLSYKDVRSGDCFTIDLKTGRKL